MDFQDKESRSHRTALVLNRFSAALVLAPADPFLQSVPSLTKDSGKMVVRESGRLYFFNLHAARTAAYLSNK